MAEPAFFLNIDKPGGWTSRDVVNRVAKIAKTKRVGHAGTLDPMATGVLVVAVGKATRLVEYVQAQHKVYVAEFRLGERSDTDDREGEITVSPSGNAPTEGMIREALAEFVGSIKQRPPAYSALKVAGKRAYDLARRGETVVLEPRTVSIEAITLLTYDYPLMTVRIVCGSGTYVRAIARDLGDRLGTGGLMSALRRTAIGIFTIDSGVNLERLDADGCGAHACPLADGVETLPAIKVNEEDRRRFSLGQAIESKGPRNTLDNGDVAVFTEEGTFLGIATADSNRNVFRPSKGGFAEDA